MEKETDSYEGQCSEVKKIEKRVPIVKGYERMLFVFTQCINRASLGKGLERHAVPGQKWEDQLICSITRKHGPGFTRGQIQKKLDELPRLIGLESVVYELMDIANYANAEIVVLLEELLLKGKYLDQDGRFNV